MFRPTASSNCVSIAEFASSGGYRAADFEEGPSDLTVQRRPPDLTSLCADCDGRGRRRVSGCLADQRPRPNRPRPASPSGCAWGWSNDPAAFVVRFPGAWATTGPLPAVGWGEDVG